MNKKYQKYIIFLIMFFILAHVIGSKLMIRYSINYTDSVNQSEVLVSNEAVSKIGLAYQVASEFETKYIELCDDEMNELATLVYLESGSESYECQKAVASVIVNRMLYYDKSLQNIIYEYNQFEPAHLISTSSPSDSTISAVKYVISNGPTIPEYVTYFRADYYHDWSDNLVDYICIDNTYFSYDKNIKEKLECLQ